MLNTQANIDKVELGKAQSLSQIPASSQPNPFQLVYRGKHQLSDLFCGVRQYTLNYMNLLSAHTPSTYCYPLMLLSIVINTVLPQWNMDPPHHHPPALSLGAIKRCAKVQSGVHVFLHVICLKLIYSNQSQICSPSSPSSPTHLNVMKS